MYFDELDLNNNVLDALYDMHFEECTPVQEKCIPEILSGKDVLGVAQTGTGKTAAYLLPILSKLDDGGYPEDSINCLIMSPTRELAQQIDQAFQGFGYYLNGVSSVAVYGGNDGNRFDQETKGLRMGADVVIATPGRFISHINIGNVDLSRTSFFVLDEADRMLDMGFSEDILSIAKLLPASCQVVMFSATMPNKIEDLAKSLLKDPVVIKLAVSKPAEKIKQSAYVCYEPQKLGIIKAMFKKDELKRVIIFCGKKTKVKEVSRALAKAKVSVGEMHSDLSQAERDDIMFKFKSGQIDVLVATDIVARGIDIDDIAMVINYDVPHDSEDYVHRIGRTARADRDGVAVTLVSELDIAAFKDIEKFLGKEIPKNPMPEGMTDGPEYKVGQPKAKSIRRKDRDTNAHRRKPRKETADNQSAKTNDNAQPQADNKGDKPRRSKRQGQRGGRKPAERQEGDTPKQPTDGKQPERRGSKPSADGKQPERKGSEGKPKHRNKPRHSRRPEGGVDGKREVAKVKTPQAAPKREGKKPEPQNGNNGIGAILKKPLKWLKSIGKK